MPSQEEWQELIDYIESNGYELKAGKALKSSHDWNENVGGSDNFGFSALPGGYRGCFYTYFFSSGYYGFDYMGEVVYFWTCTVYDKHDLWCRLLVSGYDGIYQSAYYYDEGICVCCIKDN